MRILRGSFTVLAALAALAIVPKSAQASILLEPYVGYQMTSVKVNTVSGETDVALNTPAIGARLGYAGMLFFIAADFMTATGTSTITSQPTGGTATADTCTSTMYGLDLGLRLPMLQAYVGYMISNNFTDAVSGGTFTYKGTAVKVGAGFTGLPIVAVNLEYIMHTLNTYNDGTGGSDVTVGSSSAALTSLSASTIMLTISAPFHFL